MKLEQPNWRVGWKDEMIKGKTKEFFELEKSEFLRDRSLFMTLEGGGGIAGRYSVLDC